MNARLALIGSIFLFVGDCFSQRSFPRGGEDEAYINQIEERRRTPSRPLIDGFDAETLARAAQAGLDPNQIIEQAKKIRAQKQGAQVMQIIGNLDSNSATYFSEISKALTKYPYALEDPGTVKNLNMIRQLTPQTSRQAANDSGFESSSGIARPQASRLSKAESDREAPRYLLNCSLAEARTKAENGNVDAQTDLGTRYAFGDGVLKDAVQAHAFWNIASANGSERAKSNLLKIEEQMTADQKAEATKLARELFEKLKKK